MKLYQKILHNARRIKYYYQTGRWLGSEYLLDLDEKQYYQELEQKHIAKSYTNFDNLRTN
jgi:hypothetical protein